MRARGVAYDTGFVRHGHLSRERFEPKVVRRELAIIRDDLHCNAVQIIGGIPHRMDVAARCAADLGLEVWLSPYPLDMVHDEIMSLFIDCAVLAERLRCQGADVVYVAGVELTIMNHEFFPGRDLEERLSLLLSAPDRGLHLAAANTVFEEFMHRAVAAVRERFGGKVTYAAIPFERVDWTAFDIVSVELIRNAEVADRFREAVRGLVAQGKPVAITGFGASTYRGAGDRGARGMEIVEYDQPTGAPLRLDGEYVRDESEQAAYLAEVLEILDTEGVDGAFVFLFALDGFFHRPGGDPRDDLDMASPSLVKVLDGRHGDTYPDLAWEPKAAFSAVAEAYAAPTR